jgi:hypothetical protein
VENEELLRRLDAHLDRGNRLMARNTRAFHDLRDFLAQQTEAFRLLTNEIKEFGAELRAEMRAQRQALFRILDKLA